jgi:DNA-binding GntR family transcriptional regulator
MAHHANTQPLPAADEQESARERAYRTAFNAISAMSIGEDGFLREDELVEMSGVSRTPVREALQRLQAEGMVRLMPRKGAYVAAVTPYEIEDLLQCRSMFEAFAAEAVVGELTKATIHELEDLLDQQWKAFRDQAPLAGAIELDQRWHTTLVAASRNKLIADLHQSLKNREIRLMLTVISGSGPARWEQAIEEHASILEALRKGDLGAARKAIDFHCQQTGRAALGGRLSFTIRD